MKTWLIILGVLAAAGIGMAIYFGIKNKKAQAANRLLDPNGVVTPAVVSAATTVSPTTAAVVSDATAAVADSVARTALRSKLV